MRLPVLPLMDFLLLAGWTSLFAGFVLKAVAVTTRYNPSILGLSSSDFLMIAVAALLFAIALAARTWVKTQEPSETAARRRDQTIEAYVALQRNGHGSNTAPGESEQLAPEDVFAAGAGARGSGAEGR